MRITSYFVVAAFVLAAAHAATAQFEDFEHGDPGLYSSSGGGTFSITAAAAKEGRLGAHFGDSSSFFYRTDIETAAGNTYQAWVRMSGSTRLYMGVDADSGGAISAVLASNSSSIILQDNSGWGFSDLASAPFSPDTGVWYMLELEWGVAGEMTVRLYDELGTLLAETTPFATGRTGSGGISFRSFGAGADVDSFGLAGPNTLVLDWQSLSQTTQTATVDAGLFPLVTTSEAEFMAELDVKPWAMVVIDNPSSPFATATSNAIADYIDTGGRVHASYWNLDADPALQEAMGVSSAVNFTAPRAIFAGAAAHPSWGTLTTVATGNDEWGDNGDTLSPEIVCVAGGPEVVGVFDAPGSGEGAVITSRASTLVNGFDYDSMDPAILDLVTSQLAWLRTATIGPGTPGGCYADCDGSTGLDFFDFLCFQNRFAAATCDADCDQSGGLDFFDFLCFQNEFAAGCP